MRFRRERLALLLALTLVGCGGGSDGGNGTSGTISGITITPATTQVRPGGSRSFQYTIAGSGTPNQSVTWSVSANGGAISQTGAYTAPSTVGAATVTVTSVADPTKTATAQVQIASSAVNLALSSASVGVLPGGTIDLSQYVTLTGAVNTGLTWSVAPPATGGTVNAQGVFTSAAGATGSTVVVVSSQADPSITDAFTVSVIKATLSIDPKTIPDTVGHTLHVGQALQFGYHIDVSGSTNLAVTWATTDASGNAITTDGATIDRSGNYRASLNPGTYYVTVRSAANPAVKDTATLQVAP